jgi:hypothetical protein
LKKCKEKKRKVKKNSKEKEKKLLMQNINKGRKKGDIKRKTYL